ncbi:DNA polymerase, partial [Caligus rogercresseyi]
MSVEVLVLTRPKLRPNPEFDSIGAIFYHVINDIPESEGVTHVTGSAEENYSRSGYDFSDMTIGFSDSEYTLLMDFMSIVYSHDPDIILGYETQQLSWGYIVRRGRYLNLDLISGLSKMIREPDTKNMERDLQIEGRVLLNAWRLLRSEASLYSYTFENMIFHYDDEMLSTWWAHGCNRWKAIDYYKERVVGNISILEQLDLFGRNSELARLFGIQFLESMMLRFAKAQNYVSLSPSVRQRARMRSGEYIPLVMEPESKLYTDPVLVLDFQSLYPSIIMAYNYCFTTCLGRILQSTDGEDNYEFGCSVLPRLSPHDVQRLQEHLSFSPGGIAFLQPSIRKGILPEMLHKILDARVMVKRSIKLYKNDNILKRTLHSRQLGLKLIANVTYGYTSANFSGRMPCIE